MIWVSNRGNVQNIKDKRGEGLANDFINDYEHEITDKKNEALSNYQRSSSCKKVHERYQSECGNETISDDMRNDDAAVKVC